MYLQNFLLDLLANYFDFFTMELYTLTFFHYTHPRQKTYYRSLFLIINFIISTIPKVPHIVLVFAILSFLYFYLISAFRLKESFFFWIKYQIIINLLQFLSALFCAFVNFDMYGRGNDLALPFFNYQGLTGAILAYVLLNLHINTKRLKALQIMTIYPITFSILSTGIVFLMLSFNSLLSAYTELTNILPWLYVSVIGILVLSLNSYRKIIEVLDAQMTQKLLVEKYEMELSYFDDIQSSLENLSRIRHDFKNHLIVLDSYAEQNRMEELRSYISRVNTELVTTKLISTPSDLISSILNTKNAVCQKQNVTFLTSCNFQKIYLSDFAVITILGNILDNAITAAAQTENGKVELSLLQADDYLEISCKNNHDGNIKEKNGTFTSTKEDTGALHGLGIGNVRDCVDTLRGTMRIDYDSTDFHVDILAPNHPTPDS